MESHPLPTLALIITLCCTFVAGILYLLTLQKALKKCAPASRTMKPWKVWLVTVPVFGYVWHLVVVINVAKSLRNEFARLGIPCPEPNLGENIGLAACVCNLCIHIPIPLLRGLAAIIGLVLWSAYWIRIAHYSQDLDAQQATTPALPIA